MRRGGFLLLVGLSQALTSCGVATEGDLRRAAARDLRCTEDSIATSVQRRRGTVEGCGQIATYEKICEDVYNWDFPACRWILTERSNARSTLKGRPAAPSTHAASVIAPTEALGFPFKASISDVERACTDAGHRLSQAKSEPHRYICTGAARDPGVPTQVALDFCSDRLCRLVSISDFSTDATGNKKLKGVLHGMAEKYGQPHVSRSRLGTECRKKIASCIHQGQGSWNSTWRWTRDRYLQVSTSAHGEHVRLRADYSMAAANRARPKTKEGVDTDAF